MKRLCNNQTEVSVDNKLKQLDDIYQHKQLVFKCCDAIAKYFINHNQDDLALEIMKRGFTHDISKLEKDEFYGMAEFVNDTDSLKDPKATISDNKQHAIDLHWERNEHHPEYWEDINKMPEIAIIELACDWQARSLQFGTNSIDFLKERQDTRFHFPQDVYNKIEMYLKILQNITK